MKVRRDRGLQLVRRNVRRNKLYFFQLESLSGRTGHLEVSAMDGIEGAAKQCDVHSARSYSFCVWTNGRKWGFKPHRKSVPIQVQPEWVFLTPHSYESL